MQENSSVLKEESFKWCVAEKTHEEIKVMTSNIFQNDVAIRTKFKFLPSKMIKPWKSFFGSFFSYLCLRLHFIFLGLYSFRQAHVVTLPINFMQTYSYRYLRGIFKRHHIYIIYSNTTKRIDKVNLNKVTGAHTSIY